MPKETSILQVEQRTENLTAFYGVYATCMLTKYNIQVLFSSSSLSIYDGYSSKRKKC